MGIPVPCPNGLMFNIGDALYKYVGRLADSGIHVFAEYQPSRELHRAL